MKKLMLLCIAFSMAFAMGQPKDLTPLQKKVKEALKQEFRSEKNRERDRNRAPVKALDFFRLKDDMKVIELLPGNGWYTEILGPVLKDNGELYIASKGAWLEGLDELLKEETLSKVKKLPIDVSWNREKGALDVGDVDFGMTDADMFLSIRMYHAFDNEGARKMNELAYKALKPGGYYAIIDHTRRHMEGDNDENRRRRDPVLVVKHMLEAGFEFVDYSDMFFKADDELRYEVGRKTVTGNTDRFTLLFRKPS